MIHAAWSKAQVHLARVQLPLASYNLAVQGANGLYFKLVIGVFWELRKSDLSECHL